MAVGGGGKKEEGPRPRGKKAKLHFFPLSFPTFPKKEIGVWQHPISHEKKKKTGKKKGREEEGGPSKAAHRKGIIRRENKNRIVFKTFLINYFEQKHIFICIY